LSRAYGDEYVESEGGKLWLGLYTYMNDDENGFGTHGVLKTAREYVKPTPYPREEFVEEIGNYLDGDMHFRMNPNLILEHSYR